MSNAVIHPLLDAAIIQLNSLRVMLGDQPAIHLIDGAKSQLVATKHMLGHIPDSTPQLPAMGYTDHVDVDEPQKVGEPAPRRITDLLRPVPKKSKPKGGKGHRGYATPSLISEAVTSIVGDAPNPISKNEIDATLIGHEKRFKLNGKVTVSSTKSALGRLLKAGVIKKLGERASARYVLADK
jgi:hypothetical protein